LKVINGKDGLLALAGQELGVSSWCEVTQARVDLFADATDDHQWIHVDPQRAKEGPFGVTIAHGFLTLSLIPSMSREVVTVNGVRLAVNYGLNRVRFPAPARVGSRLRAKVRNLKVSELDGGVVEVANEFFIEVDGSEKPACVAETIIRYYF
jgi:acyl dehydratase